ncbi:MAG: winged helix DNA-binding domain-containing protein [Streptococcaceae bacterium]|jgi:superfamily I DNA/RNA helicase|nr:winged helix DNA-binding domain-containing protein [Streptococcaceae bacterium]
MDNQTLTCRLASHGLLSADKTALEAIENTVGIQAQEQAHAAAISIFLRSGCTQEELAHLYAQQKVVLSWANRWTLHLFTYDDWELLINARQGENLPYSYFQGYGEHAEAILDDVNAALIRRGALTKSEIVDIIRTHLPDFSTQSYLHYAIMHSVARTGLAYIDAASPVTNRRFVYAKNFKRISANEAIEKLIPRYLAGFGPATFDDFCKWAGLKKTTVKPFAKLFENVANPVAEPRALTKNRVILGARFDSLMTGYFDKTWLVPADKIATMWTKNGFLLAPILYDGQLVGHWNYKMVGKNVTFTTEIWGACDTAQLKQKFDAVANFLQKTRK